MSFKFLKVEEDDPTDQTILGGHWKTWTLLSWPKFAVFTLTVSHNQVPELAVRPWIFPETKWLKKGSAPALLEVGVQNKQHMYILYFLSSF